MATPQEHSAGCRLPGDILTCVFQLLDTPSRICFRAVCRSWRAATAVHDPRRAARMPPPWVVIPEDMGCSRSFTLISIPTQHGFRWTPPGGSGLRCVGSNGGWLAGAHIGADRTVRVSLVNPLTDARVDVPPLGHVSFAPHHERHRPDVERALDAWVQKVAFAAPDPTDQRSPAVAVVGVTRSRYPASFGVAFARAEGWCAYASIHDLQERSRFSAPEVDVAYHDGKFYYMTTTTRGGQVWVVDMAAPCPSPAPLARFKPTPPGHGSFHLAFSGDGALHVVSSKASGNSSCNSDIFVQRYGPLSQVDSSEWTPATRLRGQCFLVGDYNQTMCVPTDDGSGGAWLRPDSVYFTGIPLCSLLAEYRACGGVSDGVWRFELDTGYIGRPQYFRKLRSRQPLEFWQPAWSRHKDDLLEEETWDRFKSGLDWSKAIWFMPSMQCVR